MLLLLIVATTAAQVFAHASRFDINHDHVILDEYSKAYFSRLVVENMWYNRTTRTFGCELESKKDVTDSWWFDFKVFQFRNNAYHLFMPMNFGMKASEILSRNYMGFRDIFEKNNIPGKLPIPKGKYRLRNIAPDSSKVPPLLVVGKYKVTTTVFDANVTTVKISWFGSVTEKISRKNN